MSTITRRERNLNFIDWDLVVGGQIFTACAPVNWRHEMPQSDVRQTDLLLGQSRMDTPDDDIATGRIHRFDSIDEMISSLKK